MKYLQTLSNGTASIELPLSKGHKVVGTKMQRRKQVNSTTLSTILSAISANLPNFTIPGVRAEFVPQLSIDKMELGIILTFPLSAEGAVQALAAPLKKLGHHASGSRNAEATRSLIHGAADSRGYHEDDPANWYPGMVRLPECRHTILINSRSKAKICPLDDSCLLPGEFSAYWPECPRNEENQMLLPAPLHTCRQLYLDCVKEKINGAEDTHSAPTYLRATFILDLNVNRALAHHSFMKLTELTNEEVAMSFFPNPDIKEAKGNDNFCPPELTQAEIEQAIRNTVDATMRVLYADLWRAMGEVPELHLAKAMPYTWQEALQCARLALVEVDRHLHADEAPKAYSTLRRQLSAWRSDYCQRSHGRRADGAEQWNHAMDETPSSISTILRQGKKRTKTPDAEIILYKKRRNYLRLELRLRGHNGICYDMPAIPQGTKPKPILWLTGNAYHVPARTNVAKSLDELVEVIKWVMITAQDSFIKLLEAMEETPTYTEEQLADFITKLRRAISKENEQAALNYIISCLREGQLLKAGIAGDAHVDRILRRLGDKGLLHYRGGLKKRRYYPCFTKLANEDEQNAGEAYVQAGQQLIAPGAVADHAPGMGQAPGANVPDGLLKRLPRTFMDAASSGDPASLWESSRTWVQFWRARAHTEPAVLTK